MLEGWLDMLVQVVAAVEGEVAVGQTVDLDGDPVLALGMARQVAVEHMLVEAEEEVVVEVDRTADPDTVPVLGLVMDKLVGMDHMVEDMLKEGVAVKVAAVDKMVDPDLAMALGMVKLEDMGRTVVGMLRLVAKVAVVAVDKAALVATGMVVDQEADPEVPMVDTRKNM
uniref:Uncharacterized protein n=1 Tax=Oryza barthii TaxID=65489 RepID=A0A0D3HE95_9ORYZ